MRIGIYTGSFDPVHKGHTLIANYLLEQDLVDEVLIIPTESYWDKLLTTPLKNRIEMLELIAKDKIKINKTLNKYEYTYQILAELKSTHENDELYLIIGADNVVNFGKWKNVGEILKNHVIVFPRSDIDVFPYINKFKEKDKFIAIEYFQAPNISSTYIRDTLKTNDDNEIKKYLDEPVYNYIKAHMLYK